MNRATYKKICTRCNLMRRGTDYYVNRSTRDGLETICIPCRREITARKKTSNKKVILDDLINTIPVDLNRECYIKARSGFGLSAPYSSNLYGKFISNEGRMLRFKTRAGYLEMVDKWDILHGEYRVKYL